MCLAIPGEVMELSERDGLRFGKVRFGGVLREVCMEYEPATRVGDFVLVHVGFAISILDREEAARTWALLEAMDQLEELDAEDP